MKLHAALCLGSLPHLCLAWPASTSVGRRLSPLVSPAPAEKEPLDDASKWTLKKVFREIPADNRVWLGFHITSPGCEPEWCYMLVHVPDHAHEASFSNQPCVGSNFTASWGYRADEDAGILTLFNPDKSRTAWFGWNHVNNSTDLPDVGPNATSETGKR